MIVANLSHSCFDILLLLALATIQSECSVTFKEQRSSRDLCFTEQLSIHDETGDNDEVCTDADKKQ